MLDEVARHCVQRCNAITSNRLYFRLSDVMSCSSHVTELPVSGADDDATAEAEDGAGSRRHVEWLVSGPDPVELMAPIELTEDEWNDAARRFSELNGDVSVSDDFRSAQPQFQSRSQTQSRQTTVDRRSDTAGRCQQVGNKDD